MPAKKYHIKLSEKERQELRMLTRKGVHPTRKVTRVIDDNYSWRSTTIRIEV